MSVQAEQKPMTVERFRALKNNKKLVCLTAYTAPMARMVDPHADMILVGDSLGMVVYGFDSTLPVTLDMMINHGRAVATHAKRALVIVDMPFGAAQASPQDAFRAAARVMAETGCAGVKIEGGVEMAETVAFLTQRGVPVMGHVGLRPQSVHAYGGYGARGREAAERKSIMADAYAVAKAGAFSVVVEAVLEGVASSIARKKEMKNVPVIGIGGSPDCDGQILVTEDMVGLSGVAKLPKFVKRYADVGEDIGRAVETFAAEVRSGAFPTREHCYFAISKKAVAAKKLVP